MVIFNIAFGMKLFYIRIDVVYILQFVNNVIKHLAYERFFVR